MSREHLVFGAVVGVVGGLTILIYGILEIYYWATSVSVTSLAGLPVTNESLLLDYGVLGVVVGLLIIVLSGVLSVAPEFRVGLGVLMILCAFVSLLSFGGGNSIGFLLVVIGGACAIAFSQHDRADLARAHPAPDRAGRLVTEESSPPKGPASPVTYRGCTTCGKVSPAGPDYCPNCGAKY